MSVETGHFALILALLVACVQGSLPMIGARRGNAAWMALADSAALAQFLLIAVSFGTLVHAHVVSDFSVLTVAANSHSTKPMLYKVAGTWGNHEGSMLLWVLILTIFGAAVAAFGRNLPPGLRARALAVQAWIAAGFYLFILFTSNPFARLEPPPLDGRGLNPLLQDPGLAFHPPFLYLGYVGFSMAFSFAVAALIEGRVDAGWARWVRPWTLAAWMFLTCGIGLGSWWAYYELGWGGWWFWDPVENASLLPWLSGTALLHSAIVVEKRDALKGWTVFLAIVTFSLSLLGTFLVRSGVLTSVHAFAVDPARGVFILALLVIVIGGSFALFAWRGPQLPAGGLFRPISREGGLLLNNLLLSTAAAAVLLGTLYPLLLEATGGGKVSVGPPFFNAVFIPLMVPLVIAMAIGPMLPWKRGDLMSALSRLWLAGLAALAAAALAWAVYDGGSLAGLFGMALAGWLLVGTLSELAGRIGLFSAPLGVSLSRAAGLPRAAWGMTLAHAGLAFVIAGITASSVWKQERIQVMHAGEQVPIAGYVVTFTGAKEVPGPNYTALRGLFAVSTDTGEPVATLAAEKRFYSVRGQETTEAAIRSTVGGDLYAVIGQPQGANGGYVTRLYFEPLVPWLWSGVGLMVLGGLVSLSDRRHRVGAPARRSGEAGSGGIVAGTEGAA
ncbi:MAG: heme lyase CcmF/NrfE family subunit [Defluviicoccus sp.]|nr:MAG: heme lyase CcmF/NrfE family subunit [Defluviicoccus sp.]